jgi:hypothetical protein
MSYTCTDAYVDLTQALHLSTPDEWDEDGLDHTSEETDLALAEIERLKARDASSSELLAALEGVLGVMNKDSDGDYFICSEAEQTIENARAVVAKATGHA